MPREFWCFICARNISDISLPHSKLWIWPSVSDRADIRNSVSYNDLYSRRVIASRNDSPDTVARGADTLVGNWGVRGSGLGIKEDIGLLVAGMISLAFTMYPLAAARKSYAKTAC